MDNAIDALKHELQKLQEAQNTCVSGQGIIRNEYKHRYQILQRDAMTLRKAIAVLESLNS